MNTQSMIERTPVTLVTGHLGSGKTTLIQKILDKFKNKKILVIENEFGEIGIDGEILSENQNALVELNAGCICCNIQSDLEDILQGYIVNKTDFDHIIIEATGVANPSQIARQFIAPSYLSQYFELISITCVIDAVNYLKHQELPEFELQVLTSDSFYLSKISMFSEREDSGSLPELLLDELGIHKESLVDDTDIEKWFNEKSFLKLKNDIPKKGGHTHYQKIAIEFEGEFDPFTLENYLNVLFLQYMGRIIRSKGILYFRKTPNPFVFQGVFDSMVFEEKQINSEASENTLKINKFVFIGKELDKENIEASLKNCLED